MTSQPTIPVKKADGTIVKMTMEEFEQYQSERSETLSPNHLITESHESESSANLPAIETPPVLANTAPVKEIFVDEAVAGKRGMGKEERGMEKEEIIKEQQSNTSTLLSGGQAEQHTKNRLQNADGGLREKETSLLEEPPEPSFARESGVYPVDRRGGQRRVSGVKEIVAKLSFKVPADLAGRLESLIDSRLRDIRTDIQFLDYAQKPVASGGLGLGEEQAEELLKAIVVPKKRYVGNPAFAKATAGEGGERRNVKFPISNFRPELKSKDVKSNPIRQLADKIQNPKQLQNPNSNPPAGGQILDSKPPGRPTVSAPTQHQDYGVARPPMHDVVAPPPVEIKAPMGPVEEIRTFSLTDWRRLGMNAKENSQKFLQKFTALQEESPLLYLEARRAWVESPLYREYLAVLQKALATGMTVESVLVGGKGKVESGKGMKQEEFDAIVEVNGKIE